MDELARRLTALRENLEPTWNHARQEHALAGVERLQRRRRRKLQLGGTAAAALACALILVGLRVSHVWPWQRVEAPGVVARFSSGATTPGTAPPEEAAADRTSADSGPLPAGAPVQLIDGSSVTVSGENAELYLEQNILEQIQLRLAQGIAHFDVVPNARRKFSVVSGAVEVIVVGTVFDVERADGLVRVAVTRGKVRARGATHDVFIQAGEARWFDQSGRALAGNGPSASVSGTHGNAKRHDAARRPADFDAAALDWRRLSQSGDYTRAYALLEKGAAVDNDAEVLMEAADAARLTGHLEAAVGYLRRVVTYHRTNPATPLAAFTLGRVLLGQLGKPSEAARAFATARELAPDGSLGQDALAREVEAWSKAGHPDTAYSRARLFIELYPQSRRRRVVELFGGLDAP